MENLIKSFTPDNHKLLKEKIYTNKLYNTKEQITLTGVYDNDGIFDYIFKVLKGKEGFNGKDIPKPKYEYKKNVHLIGGYNNQALNETPFEVLDLKPLEHPEQSKPLEQSESSRPLEPPLYYYKKLMESKYDYYVRINYLTQLYSDDKLFYLYGKGSNWSIKNIPGYKYQSIKWKDLLREGWIEIKNGEKKYEHILTYRSEAYILKKIQP